MNPTPPKFYTIDVTTNSIEINTVSNKPQNLHAKDFFKTLVQNSKKEIHINGLNKTVSQVVDDIFDRYQTAYEKNDRFYLLTIRDYLQELFIGPSEKTLLKEQVKLIKNYLNTNPSLNLFKGTESGKHKLETKPKDDEPEDRGDNVKVPKSTPKVPVENELTETNLYESRKVAVEKELTQTHSPLHSEVPEKKEGSTVSEEELAGREGHDDQLTHEEETDRNELAETQSTESNLISEDQLVQSLGNMKAPTDQLTKTENVITHANDLEAIFNIKNSEDFPALFADLEKIADLLYNEGELPLEVHFADGTSYIESMREGLKNNLGEFENKDLWLNYLNQKYEKSLELQEPAFLQFFIEEFVKDSLNMLSAFEKSDKKDEVLLFLMNYLYSFTYLNGTQIDETRRDINFKKILSLIAQESHDPDTRKTLAIGFWFAQTHTKSESDPHMTHDYEKPIRDWEISDKAAKLKNWWKVKQGMDLNEIIKEIIKIPDIKDLVSREFAQLSEDSTIIEAFEIKHTLMEGREKAKIAKTPEEVQNAQFLVNNAINKYVKLEVNDRIFAHSLFLTPGEEDQKIASDEMVTFIIQLFTEKFDDASILLIERFELKKRVGEKITDSTNGALWTKWDEIKDRIKDDT